MAEKPSVLIIGGLGYIGRFLARYIHDNDLASEVRVVDKALPQLAWLAPEFQDACAGSKFMQADASRDRKSPDLNDDMTCFPLFLFLFLSHSPPITTCLSLALLPPL